MRIDPSYPPLALLQRVTEEYPDAWEKMKLFHEMNGKNGLPRWNQWCYAPMSAAMAIVIGDSPGTYENISAATKATQEIAALAPWIENKDVFIVGRSLQERLFAQEDEEFEIDSKALYHIPYRSFYVQFADGFRYIDSPCHGVFVHLEDDVNSGDHELRLLYLKETGKTIGIPIHLEEKTVRSSLSHTVNEALKNLSDDNPEIRRAMITTLERRNAELAAHRQALQIVLYLCKKSIENAPNPEAAFLNTKIRSGEIHIHFL